MSLRNLRWIDEMACDRHTVSNAARSAAAQTRDRIMDPSSAPISAATASGMTPPTEQLYRQADAERLQPLKPVLRRAAIIIAGSLVEGLLRLSNFVRQHF